MILLSKIGGYESLVREGEKPGKDSAGILIREGCGKKVGREDQTNYTGPSAKRKKPLRRFGIEDPKRGQRVKKIGRPNASMMPPCE